jgi:glutamate-1-semialdehyde 2,1-aminomutase/spore coat polysaccharide biosynthesis protein SpsF
VLACGYHGWQDWYISSTTRSKGIPAVIGELTHKVPFNDLEAVREKLRAYPGNVAALIMEPMNVEEPNPGYLEELKELLHADGALLIFDEVVTGFRYARGGAQELFGVTPDLSSFGKAMGNGMPISAVVGRADIMCEMEEIFFSSTFGGETLSLAAAIATVDKLNDQPVIERIWETGDRLGNGIRMLLSETGLSETLSLAGKAPWTLLQFKDHPNGSSQGIKTLFLKQMLEQGVLLLGSNNICYAHDNDDVELVLGAYRSSFKLIAEELRDPGLDDRLGIPLVRPVFAVRTTN